MMRFYKFVRCILVMFAITFLWGMWTVLGNAAEPAQKASANSQYEPGEHFQKAKEK